MKVRSGSLNEKRPPYENRVRSWKRLTFLMEKLSECAIFVEGKRDAAALRALGFTRIYEMAGKPRQAAEKAAGDKVAKALILTDLDEAGNGLAVMASAELGRYGIRCDTELRMRIAGLLRFRSFEDMKKKYDEFVELNEL